MRRITDMFYKKSFRKYMAVGAFVLFITTIISTMSLYVGRELMGISLLILAPILTISIYCIGFVLKFYLYLEWDMLKDE